ncbi:MAG: Nudix family hydrolase [Proteobacteria bacterium]|nr:Nudix family hydrolase [Pseudomonadota bacterium]
MSASRIHVAVGVIFDSSGNKVLIAKRSCSQHLGGLWEFPGGKVEENESVKDALKRELHEELNINVEPARRIKQIYHDYPDKKVLLDVWEVRKWNGDVNGHEQQDIIWSPVDKLETYEFPDANKHIIKVITLPQVYLISQDSYKDTSTLISVLEKCFKSGLRIFQLRLKSRENYQFGQLVEQIKELSIRYNSRLILNGSINDINNYAIDGIHLKSTQLYQFIDRPIGTEFLLGASCHNENDIDQAKKIGVDYLFISPVNSTKSHPGIKGIGWSRFKELVSDAELPVYALGGMSRPDLKIAKQSGASGIAVISSVWESKQPDKTIKSLCN